LIRAPGFFQSVRKNLWCLEALELAILWTLGSALLLGLAALGQVVFSWRDSLIALVAVSVAWGSYLAFIRFARVGGSGVEAGLWIIASAVTFTLSFWVWITLDINRWVLTRKLYSGAIPVEYAWNQKTKTYRRAWDYAIQHGQPIPDRNEFFQNARHGIVCPVCGQALPLIHQPVNQRQAHYGGWTCGNCGSEIDWRGRLIR
jgi:hypothetical protein